MIGFNPLLDALMTQVQGARAVAPTQAPLNAPVPAADPTQATRQTHSDSRLNDMPSRTQQAQREYARSNQSPSQPSTVIHLQPTAKAIADILLRFPMDMTLPPLLIKPMSIEMLLTTPGLAQQLQSAVAQSGLFFESHLARWYRGDYPKQNLLLEPQANPRSTVESVAIPANLTETPERLSFIQRHQLELLNVPVLRMEGALIPGMFWHFDLFHYYKKVLINPVLDYGQDKKTHHMNKVWRCLSRLKHPAFGYVDFDIAIEEGATSIHFMSSSRLLMEYLRRDMLAIVDQLKKKGVDSVTLTRETVPEASAPANFDHLISLNLVSKDQSQAHNHVQSVLNREYGSDVDRILAQAKMKDIPAPMFTELMPLLCDLDFDKDIPPNLYEVMMVLCTWTVEQLPYMTSQIK